MLFTEILEELRSQSQTEVTAESFHAPQVWDGNVISTQTLGDLVELGPRTGAETLPSPERDGGEQPGVSLPPALRFILIDTTGLKLPRRQAGSLGDVVCRRQMAAIQRGQRTLGKCPASPAMAAAVTPTSEEFFCFFCFLLAFLF